MYYNANPRKARVEDCVTKAINIATGIEYYTVSKLLDLASEHTGHDRLTMQSYRYLLKMSLAFLFFIQKKAKR